jgi:hypothetical protein
MLRAVRLMLLLCLLVIGSACSLLFPIKDEFERNSKDYSKMLRWQEFERAVDLYVDPSLRDDYRKRIEAARDIKVVDYRIKNVVCDPEKRKAEVKAELDYYIMPSTKVKTVVDMQKWRYVEEADQKRWRLETLLPEFK